MSGLGPGAVEGGARPGWRDAVRFLPDVAHLLVRLMRDPRVPWTGKVVAASAAAYALSPIDVIPDVIPVVGRVDDLYLVFGALRYLVRTAGYDVVHEAWPGSHDGFAALLMLVGLER